MSEYQRSRSFFDLAQRSLRFQSYMFDSGLFTQVSDSGPQGPLVIKSLALNYLCKGSLKGNRCQIDFLKLQG